MLSTAEASASIFYSFQHDCLRSTQFSQWLKLVHRTYGFSGLIVTGHCLVFLSHWFTSSGMTVTEGLKEYRIILPPQSLVLKNIPEQNQTQTLVCACHVQKWQRGKAVSPRKALTVKSGTSTYKTHFVIMDKSQKGSSSCDIHSPPS